MDHITRVLLKVQKLIMGDQGLNLNKVWFHLEQDLRQSMCFMRLNLPFEDYWQDYRVVVISRCKAIQRVVSEDKTVKNPPYSSAQREAVYQALAERVEADPFRQQMIVSRLDGFKYPEDIAEHFEYLSILPLQPNHHPSFVWPENPRHVIEREIVQGLPNTINTGYLQNDDTIDEYAVTVWNTWRDLDPFRKQSFVEENQAQSKTALEAIRNHYSDVYSCVGNMDRHCLASILLDLFLQVPFDPKRGLRQQPADFGEDSYFDRVKEAMQRDKQRLCSVKDIPAEKRTPALADEFKALVEKFARGGEYDFSTLIWHAMEECLAHDAVPTSRQVDERMDQLLNQTKHALEIKHGNMWEFKLQEELDDVEDAEKTELTGLSRKYRLHLLIREHAMLALIPLLPELTIQQTRRLVHALFLTEDFTGTNYENFGWGLIRGRDFDMFDFGKNSKRNERVDYSGHDTLSRLFGLSIPPNVMQAMIDFFLDLSLLNSLQHSDLDHPKLKMLPYLTRHALVNPDKADLVHDALANSIEQALESANLDWHQIVGRRAGKLMQNTAPHDFCGYLLDRMQMGQVVQACIDTCALSTVNVIRRLFQTMPNCINRHTVKYGSGGLVAVLYLLGVESHVRRSDYRTEGQVHRMQMSFRGHTCQNILQGNFEPQAKSVAKQLKQSSQSPDVSEKCGHCGQSGIKLYTCTGCRSARYCGVECQKKDRKRHRPRCVTKKN